MTLRTIISRATQVDYGYKLNVIECSVGEETFDVNLWIRWFCFHTGQRRYVCVYIYACILGVVQVVNALNDNRM